MGNKIITEADFWICDTGAVPAQLQGSNESVKTPSGEKYITIKDTATSSWIDFGCTKLMLLYAVIAAAAVVIGALIVGTGGAALIALGAVAGLAGAAWGGVVGSLLCGQLAANARKWVGGKHNYLVQGMPTITGKHTMLCPVGGEVKYADGVKSWTQALALATSNYVGKLMEGAMVGALIGTGGSFLSGGASIFGTGGMAALRQAGINFILRAPANIMKNLGQGVMNGTGFKIWEGIDNTLRSYGETGTASIEDFTKGFSDSASGDFEAIKNVFTQGGGSIQDKLPLYFY